MLSASTVGEDQMYGVPDYADCQKDDGDRVKCVGHVGLTENVLGLRDEGS